MGYQLTYHIVCTICNWIPVYAPYEEICQALFSALTAVWNWACPLRHEIRGTRRLSNNSGKAIYLCVKYQPFIRFKSSKWRKQKGILNNSISNWQSTKEIVADEHALAIWDQMPTSLRINFASNENYINNLIDLNIRCSFRPIWS